jgi:hypothetical protein
MPKSKPTGRKPDHTPTYTATDLAAIVLSDRRTDRLTDARRRAYRPGLERWLEIYTRCPGLSRQELIQRFVADWDADIRHYATQIAAYWRKLRDDLHTGARFLSLDDAIRRDGERIPRRAGLRPTTDDAKAIIERTDAPGVPSALDTLGWLSLQPPITKTAAFQEWDKRLRHRTRYARMTAILADYLDQLECRGRSENDRRIAAHHGRMYRSPAELPFAAAPAFVSDGRPMRADNAPQSNGYAIPLNTASTAALPCDGATIPTASQRSVFWVDGCRIEQADDGWRVVSGCIRRTPPAFLFYARERWFTRYNVLPPEDTGWRKR